MRNRIERRRTLFRRAVAWVAGWITEARDLKQMEERGAWLVAIPAALVVGYTIATGDGRTSDRGAGVVRGLAEWLAHQASIDVRWVEALGPTGVTCVVLLFALRKERLRAIVGGSAVRLLIGCTSTVFRFGEWCVRHRTIALLLCVTSIGAIALGTSRAVQERQQAAAALKDLERWVASCESATLFSVIGPTDAMTFKALIDSCPRDERTMKADPDLRALTETVRAIWPWPSPRKEWLVELRESLETPPRIPTDEQPPTSEIASRVRTVTRALLARAYIRAAGDDARVGSSLEAAQTILGQISEADASHLRGIVSNARGQLARCWLVHKQSCQCSGGAHTEVHESSEVLLTESARYYAAAVDEFGSAEPFVAKRYANNMLDLACVLTRYHDAIDCEDLGGEWRTACKGGVETLLARRVQDLLLAPLGDTDARALGSVFATAAQTHMHSAGRQREASQGQRRDLRAAGAFLRLAGYLDRESFDAWDLRPLCTATRSRAGRAAFEDGWNTMATLPESDTISINGALEQACR